MKTLLRGSFNIVAISLFLVILLFPWHLTFESGVSLTQMLQPPSFQHPLGTDNLGRDLLVRVSSTLWDAVLPVWATAIFFTLLGFFMGGALSVTGRKQRDLVRVILSIGIGVPIGILVFYAAVASEIIRTVTLLIPLGSIIFLRSIHYVFNCYERDRLLGYWEANRSIGNTEAYRVFQYGLKRAWMPGMAHILGFHLKVAVICEVGISYLGFGIQEPKASFGNILASHFDSYLNGHFSVLLVVTLALWLVASIPEQLIALGKLCAPLTGAHKDAPFYRPPSTCKTSPVI